MISGNPDDSIIEALAPDPEDIDFIKRLIVANRKESEFDRS